jgi:hypothetical protein
MVAVLVVIAATVAWLRLLCWFYRRGTAHLAAEVTTDVPPDAWANLPEPRRPAPAAEADIAARLGVSQAGYERYVDRGLADLDIFLADHPA